MLMSNDTHETAPTRFVQAASDPPANLDCAWEQRHRRHPDQRLPPGPAPAGCPARDVSGCQPRSTIAARGSLSPACTAVPRRVSCSDHHLVAICGPLDDDAEPTLRPHCGTGGQERT